MSNWTFLLITKKKSTYLLEPDTWSTKKRETKKEEAHGLNVLSARLRSSSWGRKEKKGPLKRTSARQRKQKWIVESTGLYFTSDFRKQSSLFFFERKERERKKQRQKIKRAGSLRGHVLLQEEQGVFWRANKGEKGGEYGSFFFWHQCDITKKRLEKKEAKKRQQLKKDKEQDALLE